MAFFKNFTVAAKIWFLSALLLVNLLVVGGLGYWNSGRLTSQLNAIADIHLPAVRLMTLTDMMHDGIRANVYAAIVNSGSRNEAEMKAVLEERDEFAKNINADLAEYHIPVHLDIPDIQIHFVEEKDPHVNSLGVKGIGELGITGTAAAIANAVYHATGKRIRNLPITLDKLL